MDIRKILDGFSALAEFAHEAGLDPKGYASAALQIATAVQEAIADGQAVLSADDAAELAAIITRLEAEADENAAAIDAS